MSPRLGLIASLTTSGKSAGGGAAPAETIGTVTVTGSASPTLNSTENYAAAYDGTATGVTYTWSVTGDTLAEVSAGQGTATATITFGSTGAAVVRCQISKTGASDTPQTGSKSVTVAFNDTYAIIPDGVNTFAEGTTDVNDVFAPASAGFTVATWVKYLEGESAIVSIQTPSTSPDVYRIQLTWSAFINGQPSQASIGYYQISTSGFQLKSKALTMGTLPSLGDWVFIAGSFDKATGAISIRINGNSSSATVTFTDEAASVSDTPLLFTNFANTPDNSEYPISEFAVWDTALTATEMGSIYNSGTMFNWGSDSGAYTHSANLAHWWRFGDGTDGRTGGTDTINDMAGSSNLTLYVGESTTIV